MKNMFYFLITTALLLAGCGHGASGELTLNNGEKWPVNAEMKPHILAAEQLLAAWDNPGAYADLARIQKEHNDALIASCTMDGKPHDELHKWLHPHMELVDRLAKAKSTEEAEQIIDQLRRSFEKYHDYFQ